MAGTKKPKITGVSKNAEKINPSHIASRNVKWCTFEKFGSSLES